MSAAAAISIALLAGPAEVDEPAGAPCPDDASECAEVQPSEPRPPPPPPPAPWPKWPRRGLMLRTSAGITQCGQTLCNTIPLGGAARLDAGYRVNFFSVHLTVDGGGGRLDVPDFEDQDGTVTNVGGGLSFLFVGAGVAFYPVDLGRVDPFVGLSVGYSRVQQRLDSLERDINIIYSRGGLAPNVGLDVFIGRRMAIGPRFDVVLPFAGSLCQSVNRNQECINTADIVDADEPAVVRQRRRTLPRPWSFTVQLTFYPLAGRSSP